MQKGLLYWNSIYLLDSRYIYWTRDIFTGLGIYLLDSIYLLELNISIFVAGVSVQPFCGCTLSISNTTRALLHARVV